MERLAGRRRFKTRKKTEKPKELLKNVDQLDQWLVQLFTKLAKQTSVKKLCEAVVSASLKIFAVEGAAVFLANIEKKTLSPVAFKVTKAIENKN